MYTQSTSKGRAVMEKSSLQTGSLSTEILPEKMQAFYALENSRSKVRSCLPDDFDPDAELAMARDEKYGCAAQHQRNLAL